MTWRTAPLVVLDTETTGTDATCDRIVEIAAVRLDSTGPSKFHHLLNPCRPIGPASEIHGIFDADVESAPSFEHIAHELNDFVGTARCVAYNARFDRAMLVAEYLRTGRDAPPWLRAGAHWIDPLVWVRARDPYAKGAGRHKLGAAAERLGVTPGTAHRALGDCETTAGVLRALMPTMPDDIDELIMKQRILAAENEASFLRWLQKQSKQEKKVA